MLHHDLTTKFMFAVMAATIAPAFQYGYHIAMLNTPEEAFFNWMNNSSKPVLGASHTIIWSGAIASFAIGGMVGALLTKWFCTRLGLKGSLLCSNIFTFFALPLLVCAKLFNSLLMLIAGRYLAGINAGLSGAIAQIYIIEISPIAIRGCVGCIYHVFITISMLVAELIGNFSKNEIYWPLMYGIAVFPSFFQLLTLPFCPESPRFLFITKDQDTKAEQVIVWLRHGGNIAKEIEALKKEDDVVKPLGSPTLMKMFQEPSLKAPFIICLMVLIGQQLTGISILVCFSNEIVVNGMGFSEMTGSWCTVGINIVYIFASIPAVLLLDLFGRRIFLLWGFASLAVVTIFLTGFLIVACQPKSRDSLKFLCIACMVLFVVLYAPGVGPIPWFITAEIFHHSARILAVSLTVSANWFTNFVVIETFLPLKEAIGYYTFILFIVMDVFFYVFIYLYLPETTRKSPEDIVKLYQ